MATSRSTARWVFLFVALATALAFPAAARGQALVYLVRHAERADGGSSAMTSEADPSLSAEGRARADRLAALLSVAGVRAIYTTEFKRTKETAAPLAARLRLTPVVVASRETAGLVARLKADHPNDIVLVVAHSSTLPDVITALGGPRISVDESDYGNIFVFSPAGHTLSRLRF